MGFLKFPREPDITLYEQFLHWAVKDEWIIPREINRSCKYLYFLRQTDWDEAFEMFMFQYVKKNEKWLLEKKDRQDKTFRMFTLIAAHLTYTHNVRGGEFFKYLRRLYRHENLLQYDESKFYDHFVFWAKQYQWKVPNCLYSRKNYEYFVREMDCQKKWNEFVWDNTFERCYEETGEKDEDGFPKYRYLSTPKKNLASFTILSLLAIHLTWKHSFCTDYFDQVHRFWYDMEPDEKYDSNKLKWKYGKYLLFAGNDVHSDENEIEMDSSDDDDDSLQLIIDDTSEEERKEQEEYERKKLSNYIKTTCL